MFLHVNDNHPSTSYTEGQASHAFWGVSGRPNLYSGSQQGLHARGRQPIHGLLAQTTHQPRQWMHNMQLCSLKSCFFHTLKTYLLCQSLKPRHPYIIVSVTIIIIASQTIIMLLIASQVNDNTMKILTVTNELIHYSYLLLIFTTLRLWYWFLISIIK